MHRALPFALLLLVAACGGLHGDIQGTWKADVDAMEGEAKVFAAMIKKITITKDTITFEAGMGEMSGKKEYKYTVKSEDGNTIVLEVEDGGVKRESKIVVDGDRLKLSEDGQTLVLKPA